LIVRQAKPADAAQVAGVHVRAWQAAYRGLLPDAYLDALSADDRAARYTFGSVDPQAPRTIVALADGVLCGFATIARARDEDTCEAGELCAMYVEPALWRGGGGRALMDAVYDRPRAMGCGEAVLWVLVGNERAERFYRAQGWWADGSRRRENIWGLDADEIRYRRTLA
jgi:GNAT superfamily N-acetyltransferase